MPAPRTVPSSQPVLTGATAVDWTSGDNRRSSWPGNSMADSQALPELVKETRRWDVETRTDVPASAPEIPQNTGAPVDTRMALTLQRWEAAVSCWLRLEGVMNIGKAARASGVPAKMIRYYESTGIVAVPPRTSGGYRVYSDADVNTLRFLHKARDLGFSIDQIHDLLVLWRDRSRASADVKAIATEQIRLLDEKAKSLASMSQALRHLAEHCNGDHRPECPIIDELARPPTDADHAGARNGRAFARASQ